MPPAQVRATVTVRVRVATTPEGVARAVGRWGSVEPSGDGCVLEMSVDSLEWPVMVLAQLEADFEVECPTELTELLTRTAARFAKAAG